MGEERFPNMPITNCLYGTDHPSLRRRVDKPGAGFPFSSNIGSKLTKAERKTLRKAVASD